MLLAGAKDAKLNRGTQVLFSLVTILEVGNESRFLSDPCRSLIDIICLPVVRRHLKRLANDLFRVCGV